MVGCKKQNNHKLLSNKKELKHGASAAFLTIGLALQMSDLFYVERAQYFYRIDPRKRGWRITNVNEPNLINVELL